MTQLCLASRTDTDNPWLILTQRSLWSDLSVIGLNYPAQFGDGLVSRAPLASLDLHFH